MRNQETRKKKLHETNENSGSHCDRRLCHERKNENEKTKIISKNRYCINTLLSVKIYSLK